MSDWVNGPCDLTTETFVRTRQILVSPSADGKACPELTETKVCDLADCVLSSWSNYSVCDPLTNEQTRNRFVITPPSKTEEPVFSLRHAHVIQ